MSAGLPGLGLGGLFFIFSALLAPFRQLSRTFRGQSRPGEWAMVGRQFGQATLMVAAIDLALRLAYLGISAAGLGNTPSALSATVIPLGLIGITSGLLVGVLATAKVADVAVRPRAGELPGVPEVLSRAVPLRTLALSGAAALAWVALLVAGASDLSPLKSPQMDGATPRPQAGDAQAPSHSSRPERRLETEAISGPPSASPRRSEAVQLAAEPDQEPNGSQPGGAVRPAVSTPAPPSVAPTHQEQTPSASPAVGAASPPPASSENEPAPVASPHPTGPPPSAGPPEGSPAPEHAGPPERSELPPSQGRGEGKN